MVATFNAFCCKIFIINIC